MSNGPKFGRPGKPPKLPVRLNAKPTRPHKVRRGELQKKAVQQDYACENRFTDEPYCDLCGAPHGGWWNGLRRLM